MRLFTNSLEAVFVSRPNRFVITAKSGEKLIRAHCPNPGRLEEILHPGRTLIFEEAGVQPASPAPPPALSNVRSSSIVPKPEGAARKTAYTLVGVHYKGKVIPLYSGRANHAARELIIPRLFPWADTVVPEYRAGSSRFDFFLTGSGRSALVEVKACTLVEHGVAMFPDAPSLRGKRHIEELAVLGGGGNGAGSGHVLFVVMHEDAHSFVPNIHTDPAFAASLAELCCKIGIHAASLSCSASGEASLVNCSIPVDLGPAALARRNAGVYFLLIELSGDRTITAGALPAAHFSAGFYVYAGSARKNLQQRLQRHTRKRKKLHWHIDYLLAEAASVKGYPILSAGDLECRLAADIGGFAEYDVSGFGSSDCSCPSHLFYFSSNPMDREEFTDLLCRYRHIDGLEGYRDAEAKAAGR